MQRYLPALRMIVGDLASTCGAIEKPHRFCGIRATNPARSTGVLAHRHLTAVPQRQCATVLLDQPRRTRQFPAMPSFVRRIPEGDNRERSVCTECGFVAYENPKVIVGSVIVSDGQVLMCRRAIEPRRGFWTLPAGYLELGETLQEGAAREALEEAGADIAIDGMLGVFTVARISQVQVIFRAGFRDPGSPRFGPGPESLDVRLFRPMDIPREEIAFPSVHWALNAWSAAGPGPLGRPAGNPPEDIRGVGPLPDTD